MAISHKQKITILDDLTTNVASQKAVVLLNTQDTDENLDSQKNFDMRSKARESGIKIQVVKNTLIKKTFESVEGFPTDFTGATYLAYLVNGEEGDEVTVPKAIVKLVEKEFKESLKVLGSVVNGEFYETAKTVQLSKTPSFTDSMSMTAGMLQSVISRIAVATREVPTKMVRGISEYSKTLS